MSKAFQGVLVPTDKLISDLKNFPQRAFGICEGFSFSNSNRKDIDDRVFSCVCSVLYRTQNGKLIANFLKFWYALPTLYIHFFFSYRITTMDEETGNSLPHLRFKLRVGPLAA